jgi:hypothetical protein
MLFLTLDLAFLCLGIGYLDHTNGAPNLTAIKAGGGFGLLAAFLAWYNAFAGLADSSNRYVLLAASPFVDIANLFVIASSSCQSRISHGRTRDVSYAGRSATTALVPRPRYKDLNLNHTTHVDFCFCVIKIIIGCPGVLQYPRGTGGWKASCYSMAFCSSKL